MKSLVTALMAAVAVAGLAIAASAQPPANPETRWMPVELQCPTGNTGNLTLIMKNHSGESRRIRTTFVNGAPIDAHYDSAQRGEAYQNQGRLTKGGAGNALGEKALLFGNTVFTDICQGSPEDRQRYMSKLAANAETIRAQGPRTQGR